MKENSNINDIRDNDAAERDAAREWNNATRYERDVSVNRLIFNFFQVVYIIPRQPGYVVW